MKDFTISRVTKAEAGELVLKYHYLKDISKGFRSGYNYGLWREGFSLCQRLEGVCIFTGLPVPELAVGAFGLDRNDQDGLFELSRLCIHPDLQGEGGEHNLASWLVSRSIKKLKADLRSEGKKLRAIISYADSGFHGGTIYRACNFMYCGLSAKKYDYVDEDGRPVSRGSTKFGKKWRNQKHRFVMIFDKNISLKWEKS